MVSVLPFLPLSYFYPYMQYSPFSAVSAILHCRRGWADFCLPRSNRTGTEPENHDNDDDEDEDANED